MAHAALTGIDGSLEDQAVLAAITQAEPAFFD
jgi:hypothetical protein